MNKLSVVGLDLAKNVFQVHGIDADGGFTVIVNSEVSVNSV